MTIKPHTLPSRANPTRQPKLDKECVFSYPRTEEKEKKRGTTKYKKHRADRGFREFSALNKLSARQTSNCSECPTVFTQTVGRHLLPKILTYDRTD
jgi:hypothetical protein